MYELIIAALQKRGIDGDNRLLTLARKTRRESHRMLLGDTDIEITLGKTLLEFDQAAAFTIAGVIPYKRLSAWAISHSQRPNTRVNVCLAGVVGF